MNRTTKVFLDEIRKSIGEAYDYLSPLLPEIGQSSPIASACERLSKADSLIPALIAEIDNQLTNDLRMNRAEYWLRQLIETNLFGPEAKLEDMNGYPKTRAPYIHDPRKID